MKIEKSIRDKHVDLTDQYGQLQDEVVQLLKDTCESNGWIFKSRLKSLQSYALKLTTARPVDDFFGCSIVVPTVGEIHRVVTLIEGCLTVTHRRPDTVINYRPTDFHFDSLRLYCKLNKSVNPSAKHKLVFEIQVKTLLEEAWSKATHDFSYKSDTISWAKERLAAQLKAMLDNVELSISQISMLSSTPLLEKTHREYGEKADILTYLRDELGGKSGVIMPEDLRRLADVVYGLLKFLKSDLNNLKSWIAAETAVGRGAFVTDLSVYSIILQAAVNQNVSGFARALDRNDERRKIFVTREVELPDVLNINSDKIIRI